MGAIRVLRRAEDLKDLGAQERQRTPNFVGGVCYPTLRKAKSKGFP